MDTPRLKVFSYFWFTRVHIKIREKWIDNSVRTKSNGHCEQFETTDTLILIIICHLLIEWFTLMICTPVVSVARNHLWISLDPIVSTFNINCEWDNHELHYAKVVICPTFSLIANFDPKLNKITWSCTEIFW